MSMSMLVHARGTCPCPWGHGGSWRFIFMAVHCCSWRFIAVHGGSWCSCFSCSWRFMVLHVLLGYMVVHEVYIHDHGGSCFSCSWRFMVLHVLMGYMVVHEVYIHDHGGSCFLCSWRFMFLVFMAFFTKTCLYMTMVVHDMWCGFRS